MRAAGRPGPRSKDMKGAGMSSHLVWSPSCTLDTIFRWDIVLDRLIVSQDDGRSWHDARKAWGDSWEQEIGRAHV